MQPQKAADLFAKFAGKKVAVVGDVMLDCYLYGRVERLNPEMPAVPLLSVEREECMSGGAGNVAKNLACFGADVTLVGVAGKDDADAKLKAAALFEGYELKLTASSRPTTVKTRYLVDGHYLLRADKDRESEVTPDEEKKLIKLLVPALLDAEGVLVSDYAKGVATPRILAQVMKAVKRGIIALGDMKPANVGNVKGITMLSPNIHEGRHYLGMGERDESVSSAQLALRLARQFRSRIFLTAAAEGIVVCEENGTPILVPQVHQIAVADTSGCGDTAAAMILLSTLAGATPYEAATLANAAGAVVASKVGAVAPTKNEILGMLSRVS